LLDAAWSSERVADEVVGFHCQQAAEKLLKAMLSEFGLPFARTHNLRVLIDLLSDAGHLPPPELAGLDVLTPFGTVFRYEEVPSEAVLDRRATQPTLQALHNWVRQAIQS
jgi:HEPN domain-containing protein